MIEYKSFYLDPTLRDLHTKVNTGHNEKTLLLKGYVAYSEGCNSRLFKLLNDKDFANALTQDNFELLFETNKSNYDFLEKVTDLILDGVSKEQNIKKSELKVFEFGYDENEKFYKVTIIHGTAVFCYKFELDKEQAPQNLCMVSKLGDFD